MLNLNSLKQSAQALLSDNASAIMTAGGVIGTVGTAVLTGRASYKTGVVWANRPEPDPEMEVQIEFTRKDLARAVWPEFVPPVILGSATIASIIMANRISAKQAAALAAAYGISERSFQEYREKTLERLGIKQEQKLRDDIAQDRVSSNPSSEVVVLATGEVLCYDMLTGRYFRSTMEEIKRAENVINKELLDYQQVRLSRFFEEVGLPATAYTDDVGWNQMNGESTVTVQVSTTMSPDEKPCLAIDFSRPPRPDYTKLY